MKLLQSLMLIVLPLLLISQNNEGEIIYNESIKMEIDIPEEHREQFKAILPDLRESKKVLQFNEKESLYKDHKDEETEQVVESGSEASGMHMKMIIQRPDNQLYKNLDENTVYEKQEFFGRDFLVTDNEDEFEWKMINEEKEILGYVCSKALSEKDGKKVEAWYTTQIPVANGPMQYGRLPGMILELDVDDGQTHVVASEINLMKLDKNTIHAPKKGKKVSRDEYNKIVEKKEKEMEEEYGSGGGQVIIKTRNR